MSKGQAAKPKKPKVRLKCAECGISDVSCESTNISLHRIPFARDTRQEAVKRRRRWLEFVWETREDWIPRIYSAVCSKHFLPRDYTYMQQDWLPAEYNNARLRRDKMGVCVWPTVHETDPSKTETKEKIFARVRQVNKISFRTAEGDKLSLEPTSSNEDEDVVEVKNEEELAKYLKVQVEQQVIFCKNVETQTEPADLTCLRCGMLQKRCVKSYKRRSGYKKNF